jgi:hypothetical protein
MSLRQSGTAPARTPWRGRFKSTLDSKVYHVETDDGEDVLVKKRKGPDFELKFVESTVESVRIHLKKE